MFVAKKIRRKWRKNKFIECVCTIDETDYKCSLHYKNSRKDIPDNYKI